DVRPRAGASVACSGADRHVRLDLFRRRIAARIGVSVVQPAHVDDEAHARGSGVEGTCPARAASLSHLPTTVVRADDAQSRGVVNLSVASHTTVSEAANNLSVYKPAEITPTAVIQLQDLRH